MTDQNQTNVSSPAPSPVTLVLKKYNLEHATGTAEMREVVDQPGMENGTWVYWNGKPLEKVR